MSESGASGPPGPARRLTAWEETVWVEFDQSMGHYEKGQREDLPPPIARRAIRIGRAHRVEGPGGVETATRRPTEHAAKRTRDPSRHGWEYVRGGWWQSPEGRKVRGPQDATIEQLQAKLSGD